MNLGLLSAPKFEEEDPYFEETKDWGFCLLKSYIKTLSHQFLSDLHLDEVYAQICEATSTTLESILEVLRNFP